MNLAGIDMLNVINRFVLCVAISAVLFFVLMPYVDLSVSSVFYSDQFKADFFLYDWVYDAVRPITFMMTLFLLGEIIFFFVSGKNLLLPVQCAVFFLLCWLIGPGLIVNVVFKDHYGRPRPHQIVNFGGEHAYVKPFEFSRACHKNCSFVSGHASVGFVFIGLAFVYRRQRYWIALGSIFAGSVIGFVRVAQGGHFLSDIVFSFLFTYLGVYLSYALMRYLGHQMVISRDESGVDCLE
ncbi:MAG: phosphatase PAP2 family protein [Pseudomonadota bacterium]|nr:phosphatase PAP2 family protein [Pseudomonadota bacterium]